MSRLSDLLSRATPGIADIDDETVLRVDDTREIIAVFKTPDNTNLFSYLRNHAEEFVALIEAALKISAAIDEWHDANDVEEHNETLRKALAPFGD